MKTLKDFDCVHCNDKCDGFKCDAYTIHESHALSADVLKQEAIKWVKEDFELVKNKEAHQRSRN